jgi:hypothetical protein
MTRAALFIERAVHKRSFASGSRYRKIKEAESRKK